MDRRFDVLIVGCGIVGAATAFELSKYNLRIGVLEKGNDVALGTTKANSAIIHAGYDPESGSLMARLNVRGSELAGEICEKLDVPYKRNGALVVAFDEEEVQTLKGLLTRGTVNGVRGLRLLTGDEARAREKNLSPSVAGALYVPTSAIVSPWEYCLALAETAVKNGAELMLNTEVKAIEREEDLWKVETNEGEFEAPYIVNAAGVDAIRIHGMVAEPKYRSMPRRGEYFLLDKVEGSRTAHTVFQCPNEDGKGVLVTPTVHGNLLIGPNSSEVKWEDTSNTNEGLAFVKEKAMRSVEGIMFNKSIRNFAGVRATTDHNDFIIEEAAPGFIDCCGICSPGLSAAPAIAEYAAELLSKSGLSLERKEAFIFERKRIRFNELNDEERAALVSEDPSYGRVICRCETVTEGEIMACFDEPIPPVSIDGVKRRVGTGMGRCQGGFCGPRIAELFVENRGLSVREVLQDRAGSEMFTGMTKEGR
ncbi:MAG: NAD(P)/FAD-dependent oxidoreductase [Firmicutes bacterium]|nr:NAD(P)/FAD-dependent oxidoreductase [Bacillota bacterium]